MKLSKTNSKWQMTTNVLIKLNLRYDMARRVSGSILDTSWGVRWQQNTFLATTQGGKWFVNISTWI